MAMVFGAGIGNSVNVTTLLQSYWNPNMMSLTCCWVYPTTLTATRSVWKAGTVSGLQIDTTTTSFRFVGDAATTDGVWTFPAGLATNTWTFVAVAANAGAAATAAVKAWTGTASSAPIERTVTTATAPVGAMTTSGSAFTIGNTTTGSATSWQGEIGAFTLFVDAANSTLNTLGVPADGALDQARADHLFRNFVVPLWRGDHASLGGFGQYRRPAVGVGVSPGWQLHLPLETASAPTVAYRNTGQFRCTVTGATLGQRNPRPVLLVEHQQRHPLGCRGTPARG